MTRVITDKKELYKLIAFLVMGDGGVYHMSKKVRADGKPANNARFVMTQREDHLDFCEYAADIIENVTSTKIRFIDRSADTDWNRRNQYRIESMNHPVMTHMRERIYVDKYKSIDPHYLKMLDWECLAILYMGDGSYDAQSRKGSVNVSHNVRLHIKRLSYGDMLLLKKSLKDNLGLEWNINKAGKYLELRLRSKDVEVFAKGIQPFVVPSYAYKVPVLKSYGLPLTVQGDDIVCPSQQCEESSGNDLAPAA